MSYKTEDTRIVYLNQSRIQIIYVSVSSPQFDHISSPQLDHISSPQFDHIHFAYIYYLGILKL